MKCSSCLALNAASDTICFSCGSSLQRQREVRAAGNTPAWGYFFAVACGIIPIISLGGCVPVALGLGGAGGCLQVARSHSLPVALRVVACMGITAVSWVIFGLLILAIAEMTRG
ncbi:MAG TPA: hypothetical protein VKI65_01180 [Gemmataceae bacterium]|nr:hypothetical protein [Gemmataceae bacterium]